MSIRSVLSISALMLCLAASAHAQSPSRPDVSPPAVAETLTDQRLEWSRPPSIRDMGRFYPRQARRNGYRRGSATVRCTADARGRLACTVVEEDPVEMRFGEAALNVMRAASVRGADGYSPEGRTFRFTLRFGNWPAHLLPDKFQPTAWGLNWVERPAMTDWDGTGQARGETYHAAFACVARADGSLDCTLEGTTPETGVDRFAAAAQRAMERARVRRIDDRPLEGSPLRHVIAITRQNN